MISIRAPQYLQYALIRDFLDLVNFSTPGNSSGHRKRSKVDLKVEASEPGMGHCDRDGLRSHTKYLTADVQYAIDKCESLGSSKQFILHGKGIHRKLQKIFQCMWQSSDVTFLPNMLFEVLYDSQQFFSTAFETRAWTMVVFRKE